MPEQPLTAAELAELRRLLQGPWVHAVAYLRNAAPRLLAAAEEAERLREENKRLRGILPPLSQEQIKAIGEAWDRR